MANHISNGVFETNTATGSGQAPDGWTATSSTPDLQTDGGYEWAGSYMPGDLNASSGSGYVTMFTNASKVEALSTTLDTPVLAGETYTFEFDFYVNESNGTTNQGGASNLIVTIGSQTLTIPIDSTGASAPYWQTTSFTFTATDTSASFTISNETDPGALGFTGVALDNLNLDIQSDYIVSGTAGNDTIDAFYLDDVQGDQIDASDHSDNSNADSVLAGAGNDIIVSGADNDTVFGQDGSDTIEGGAGDDILDGDDADSGGAADLILGEAGNDQIVGDVGNDTLDGGIGNDTIFAGADDDSVLGGDGDDQIFWLGRQRFHQRRHRQRSGGRRSRE